MKKSKMGRKIGNFIIALTMILGVLSIPIGVYAVSICKVMYLIRLIH